MRKLGWGLIIFCGITLLMNIPILLGSFSLDGSFHLMETHIYGFIGFTGFLLVGIYLARRKGKGKK